jgi:hypothetical protein
VAGSGAPCPQKRRAGRRRPTTCPFRSPRQSRSHRLTGPPSWTAARKAAGPTAPPGAAASTSPQPWPHSEPPRKSLGRARRVVAAARSGGERRAMQSWTTRARVPARVAQPAMPSRAPSASPLFPTSTFLAAGCARGARRQTFRDRRWAPYPVHRRPSAPFPRGSVLQFQRSRGTSASAERGRKGCLFAGHVARERAGGKPLWAVVARHAALSGRCATR